MQKKNGFTLLELLIVIAVIGILAGMLIPQMSGSMEKAREQKCRNNLRQLQAACNGYATDHNGYYPFAQSFEWYEGVPPRYYEKRGWVSWVPSDLNPDTLDTMWEGKKREQSQTPNLRDDLGTGEIARFAVENGTLWDYVGDFKFYVCPVIETVMKKQAKAFKDDFEGTGGNAEYEVYRTYAMNPAFYAQNNRNWESVKFTRVNVTQKYGGRVIEAAKTLLFAEIFPSPQNNDHVSRSSVHSEARGGNHDYDCCIDPEEFDSTHEMIAYNKEANSYGVHSAPDDGYKSAFVVFADGHIEKVYSRTTLVEDGSQSGNNVAWFLNRSFTPGDDDPTK